MFFFHIERERPLLYREERASRFAIESPRRSRFSKFSQNHALGVLGFLSVLGFLRFIRIMPSRRSMFSMFSKFSRKQIQPRLRDLCNTHHSGDPLGHLATQPQEPPTT